MQSEGIGHKRVALTPIESKSPFKKQHTEKLSVEERVDELYCNLMSAYNNGDFIRGLLDKNFKPIPQEGVEAWRITLINFIRFNPNVSNIWDLVFKKLDLPSNTIPFGYGLSVTLPSVLWDYHTSIVLKDNSSDDKNLSPKTIQTFIQCLQACSSHDLLTEENWPYIMKLAKKHSINWLFIECLQISSRMAPK